MSQENQDPLERRHGRQMDSIHRELWVFEGDGPPGDDELLSVARYKIRGAAEFLDDFEEDHDLDGTAEEYLSLLRDDVLKTLVALEMIQGYRGKPDAYKEETA